MKFAAVLLQVVQTTVVAAELARRDRAVRVCSRSGGQSHAQEVWA